MSFSGVFTSVQDSGSEEDENTRETDDRNKPKNMTNMWSQGEHSAPTNAPAPLRFGRLHPIVTHNQDAHGFASAESENTGKEGLSLGSLSESKTTHSEDKGHILSEQRPSRENRYVYHQNSNKQSVSEQSIDMNEHASDSNAVKLQRGGDSADDGDEEDEYDEEVEGGGEEEEYDNENELAPKTHKSDSKDVREKPSLFPFMFDDKPSESVQVYDMAPMPHHVEDRVVPHAEIDSSNKETIARSLERGNKRASVAIITSAFLGKTIADDDREAIANSMRELNKVAIMIQSYLLKLFISSISGIFLMIIENEILHSNDNKPQLLTTIIKLILTMSTIFSGPVLSKRRYCVLLLEFCIISIHPLPGLDATFKIYNGHLSKVHEFKSEYTYDAILGIMMFSRFYLIGRLFYYVSDLHARMAEVISNINKVELNTTFALKSILNQYPIQFLLAALIFNVVVSSYCVMVCERSSPDSQNMAYLDSIWFMFVTIATIGYGDITLKTYCARSFASVGSAVGFITTTLLIMVADQARELTTAQKKVVSILARENWKRSLQKKAVLSVQKVWRSRKQQGRWNMIEKFRASNAIHDWKQSRRDYNVYMDELRSQSNLMPVFEQLVRHTQDTSRRFEAMEAQMYRLGTLMSKIGESLGDELNGSSGATDADFDFSDPCAEPAQDMHIQQASSQPDSSVKSEPYFEPFHENLHPSRRMSAMKGRRYVPDKTAIVEPKAPSSPRKHLTMQDM